MKKWLCLGLLAAWAHADPTPIPMPARQPDAMQVEESTAAAQPISTSVVDAKDKNWQEYSNRIVKASVHVKTAWTMMEMKETRTSGTVSFTLSHDPLATFSIMREPLDGSFDDYVSSPSLTSIYPSGFKESRAELAGKKATLVEGKATDGRFDQSYFVPDGSTYVQVSFSAPQDSWKDFQTSFADLQQSFRWLP